jgi:dUTPase
VLVNVDLPDVIEVSELAGSERDTGGFGSSGS